MISIVETFLLVLAALFPVALVFLSMTKYASADGARR
jgi:hypothetical protein